MLGQPPRFYSVANLQQLPVTNSCNNTNPIRSLSRLADDAVHFDLNRNSLGGEHQFYQNNPVNFYGERKLMNINRPNYASRGSMARRMNYTPYPMITPAPCFKTGLTPPERPEYNHTATTQVTQQNKQTWPPMEQMGEFCNEILNRDKHYWSEEETSLMLELYEENRDHFNDTKTKKTKIWSVIATIVNKRFNTSINSEQCSQKYRNLKAEFLKVADTSEDGGARKFGIHYAQMRRLLEAEEKSLLSLQAANNKSTGTEWIKDEVIDSNDKNLILPTIDKQHESSDSKDSTPTSECSLTTSDIAADMISGDTTQIENDASMDITAHSHFENSAPNSFSAHLVSQITKRPFLIDNLQQPLTVEGHPSSLMLNQQIEGGKHIKLEEQHLRMLLLQKQPVEPSTDDKTESNLKIKPKKQKCKTKNHRTQYGKELHEVFNEYFLSRDRELETYILKQKENIECMNKCISVFHQALKSTKILS